jgi:apolipoprotein N-acyltransferase
LAYYSAASLPVIGVAKVYWPSSEASAVFMWLAAAALLSVPWFFCWTRLESLRPWTAAIAVALSAVPPICIIGWASPLLSAGVLFPDSAWFGIAAVLALPGLLIHKRTRTITLVATGAVSLFLNIQLKHLRIPTGWQGEMTQIHRPRKANDLADFSIEEQLQRVARTSSSKVLVFPEGAVRLWTDATDAFWAQAVSEVGKTLLIGAGQPIPGSTNYYNSVVIVGDHARPTEQLLTWPMLRSAIEKPTLLIAISNEAWTAATIVPWVQHACVRAWARLFGLPVVSAINS